MYPKSQSIAAPEVLHATTIDNLIRFAKSTKHDKALLEFREHYDANPELVPFLVRQLRKQIRKFGWGCFDLAWAVAFMELDTPGGPEFKLCARLKTWYNRGILCTHPRLMNGRLEVHKAAPDEAFGLSICETKLPDEYGRRLQWADGSPLTKLHPALRAGVKPVQALKEAA